MTPLVPCADIPHHHKRLLPLGLYVLGPDLSILTDYTALQGPPVCEDNICIIALDTDRQTTLCMRYHL
jgi:hypothetical protein